MVRVVCRIKPPIRSNTRITNDGKLLFTKIDKDIENKDKYSSKIFKLDKFYDDKSSNINIFNNEVSHLLNESFCLFLYGHTGSGKTYTLLGNNQNKGIIQILLEKIHFRCKIEILELRPSGCYDLLNNQIVSLFENNNKTKIYNLSNREIKTKNEFQNILDIITKYRVKGISKHNLSSSRTHLIINIYNNNNKYTLIDLAGNERSPIMKKGQMYHDTNYINTSLLALKECFRKINSTYIPYRRSKLTRLLKNVFEKKINSIIITTIHSGYNFQNETSDTLSYISQFHSKFELVPNTYSIDKIKRPNRKPPPIITTKYKYDILDRPKTSPKLSNNYIKNKNYYSYIPRKHSNNKLEPLKYNYINEKYINEKNINEKYINEKNIDEKNIDEKNINEKYIDEKNIDEKEEYSYKYNEDKPSNIKNTNKNNYKIYNNNPKISEEKYHNKNYKIIRYNPSNHNIKLFYETAKKSFTILNHILYSRTIKNYVKLTQMDNDEEITDIMQSTLSTIEVVLNELTKLSI